MKKQTAYIFAAFIVVLIILAIVIMWLTGGIGGNTDTDPSAEPGTASASPRQTQFVIPTDTPAPTETPAPTPTATPAPAPTPVQPEGTVVGSGAFDSATGTGLNTHTVWTAAEQSDGSVKLSLSVYVRSYTLEIGPRSVAVSVNGSTVSGLTRAFSVDAPNVQVDTLIYTCTVDVSGSDNVAVAVEWNYKGQYSGKDIDMISSSASISF